MNDGVSECRDLYCPMNKMYRAVLDRRLVQPLSHQSPDHGAGHPPLTTCRRHLRLSERPKICAANRYYEVTLSLLHTP
jgi:hypothetical protein